MYWYQGPADDKKKDSHLRQSFMARRQGWPPVPQHYPGPGARGRGRAQTNCSFLLSLSFPCWCKTIWYRTSNFLRSACCLEICIDSVLVLPSLQMTSDAPASALSSAGAPPGPPGPAECCLMPHQAQRYTAPTRTIAFERKTTFTKEDVFGNVMASGNIFRVRNVFCMCLARCGSKVSHWLHIIYLARELIVLKLQRNLAWIAKRVQWNE